MKKKLTDARIRDLPIEPKRYEVWGGDGLGVRVGPSGSKSWILLAHDVTGRSRRYTLGRYRPKPIGAKDEQEIAHDGRRAYLTLRQAHTLASKYREKLEQGIDPGTEKQDLQLQLDGAWTVKALADEYLERHAKAKKKSWKADKSYLDRFVIPAWGAYKAENITKRMVVNLLDKVAPTAPTTANRLFAIVRRMFNFAVERDILQSTPCLQVKAPALENRRDRTLSSDEIRTFWSALLNVRPPGESFDPEKYSPISEGTSLALRLQMLTAQRIGEVVGMSWNEIDMKGAWWTISASRSKNGLPHRVPLSDLVLAILRRAKKLAPESTYVFPGKPLKRREGAQPPIPYTVVDYALRRTRLCVQLDHFTPHDLRRTAATRMASSGVPRLVIGRILNHSESRDVTAIYDRHGYDNEKREALDQWAKNLAEITTSHRQAL